MTTAPADDHGRRATLPVYALVADMPDRRSERIVGDNRPEWSMNGFGDNSLMWVPEAWRVYGSISERHRPDGI